MNRLLNANHRMLINLRHTFRASQRRRWMSSGLSLALVLVPLLGTQRFTPSVRAASAASPSAQTQERPQNIIIRDLGYDEAAVAEVQEQVIDELLTAHQLPSSDRQKLIDWERDLVRAGLFSKIVGIARKDPATVTPSETSLINTLTLRVMQRRAAAAVAAQREYQKWERDPCAYSAPAGFPQYSRPCSCYSRTCGLFGGPKPPSFESFQAYGAVAAYSHFKDDLVAQTVAANTAKEMGTVFGLAAVAGTGVASLAAGFAGLGLAIVYSLHPIFIAGTFSGGVAGSTLAAAAAPAFSVGFAGGGAVVVLALVAGVFEGIGVVEAAETPGKLQLAVDNASFARDHITNSLATLKTLVETPTGYQEVYFQYISSTLGDFPATTSVPPPSLDDQKFLLLPNNTVISSLKYLSGADRKQHTVRLSGGWFVDKKENEAERLTLDIDYQEHTLGAFPAIAPNGEPTVAILGLPWTASRRGLNFVHNHPRKDLLKPFTSPEIKYLDWDKKPVKASIVVPAHTIEAVPARVAKNRTVRQAIAVINTTDSFKGGRVFIDDGVAASSNGVNVTNLALDDTDRLMADVSATCGAGDANFTLRFVEFGGVTVSAKLPVSVSLVADNPLPFTLPSSKASERTFTVDGLTFLGPEYRAPLSASYGCSEYDPVLSVEDGQLPPGLSLAPARKSCDGSGNCTIATEIIGTTTSAGQYPFTLKLSFFGGETYTRDYDVTVTGRSAEAPPGMIGWWRGEGDTTDASETLGADNRPNHARPADPAVKQKYAAGRAGRGFKFEGEFEDSILLPGSIFPAPPLTQEQDRFSFETWFKIKPGFAANVILGQENADGTDGLPAVYVGWDGKLRAQMFSNGAIDPITSTGSVNDNAFHHVAVTHDGGVQSVYLDGELIGSRTGFVQTAYASEYRYRLGAGRTTGWPFEIHSATPPHDGYAFFNGVIDEPAIYNRALSTIEVRRIFAAGGAGKVAIDASAGALSCFNDYKGSIGVEARGVNLPYTYALNDGPFQAEPFFGGLAAGDYQVKVKDSAGNIYTRPETLTVSEPPFNLSHESAPAGADGGGGQVRVTHEKFCSFAATSDNPSFIFAAANPVLGTFDYAVAPNPETTPRTGTVTVTNGYVSRVFTIRQEGRPAATVSGGGMFCPGGSATVSVNLVGGTAPYTVTLTNGGGTVTGSTMPLTFAVSPTTRTTYAVQSATDAKGVQAVSTGSATAIPDDVKPVLDGLTAITVAGSSSSGGAAVAFPVTATDNCGTPALSFSRPSGSIFPFGTTTVTATATDAGGNSSQASFTVTVLTPQQQAAAINNHVQSLVAANALTAAQGAALSDKLTQVNAKLDQRQTHAACNQLSAFANQVNGFVNARKLTAEQGQSLVNAASALAANIGCP